MKHENNFCGYGATYYKEARQLKFINTNIYTNK